MGNVNCCKKPEEELRIEGKETIDVQSDSFQDKDEYPHDSDPAFRNRKYQEDKPEIKEISDNIPGIEVEGSVPT